MGSWGLAEDGWRKGPWTSAEDQLLIEHVKLHGEGRWNNVYRLAGLKRNGKSCRLRWVNYLRPDVKRGQITPQEERVILELHARWGNRWSRIAKSLPGRTDNDIKNYWRTHFKRKGDSKNPEKLLLRRQQFQLQQQQEREQRYYQQNQMDTKEMEGDKHLPTAFTQSSSQENPYLPNYYSVDEHEFVYSMIHGCANLPDHQPLNEYMIMCDDGTWNLDDYCGENVTNRADYCNYTQPPSSFCGSFS